LTKITPSYDILQQLILPTSLNGTRGFFMYSVFVLIMVISSILVLFILPKIESKQEQCDMSNNWRSVWEERLKIDN